jgi:cytidylate kinase
MPNVVKIFITASIRFRIDQILAHKNVTPQQAKRIILEEEGKRASYYNFFTGKKWGAAESYDLCIDSSILGMVETEKLIADFIRKKFNL